MRFPATEPFVALAQQIGEVEVATLLSHTLGEEEAADALLTRLSKPLLQQAQLDDMGGQVNLGEVPETAGSRRSQPVNPAAGRARPAARSSRLDLCPHYVRHCTI